MRTLYRLVLVLGVLQLSCSKSTDNVEDPPPTEDLGEPLHNYGMWAHGVSLTWSKNTDELFTAGPKGIEAIDLQHKTVRTIEKTDGIDTPQASWMILSNDGNTIFYMLLGPSSHGPLYSISIDGQDRQLLDSSECTGLRQTPDD
jgi:hypothetical protein